MKKYLILVLAAITLTLAACSGGGSSDLTLQNFIDAYEKEGVEVSATEKPMFSMIGAKDGAMFYVDNEPVKIYEYESEKDISTGEESLPAIADWEKNGKFILETTNQKAIDIFKSVK